MHNLMHKDHVPRSVLRALRPIGAGARPWLAGAAAFTLAASAQALTPGVDTPPLPAPPMPIGQPQLAEHKLPNGLTLVVAERHDAPLVTAALMVRAGLESDPPGKAGVSSLAATLLSKGATRDRRAVSAPELVRQAEALGGELETASSARATTVSMTITTPRIQAALALIADVARRPTFATVEVQRAREQTIDELKLSYASPGAVASLAANHAYWGPSTYGSRPTPQTMRHVTADDVRQFHRQWFRPDAATLVLAGDVTMAQAVAWAETYFGDWKAPRMMLPDVSEIALPPKPMEGTTILVDMPGSGQSAVVVAAPFASGLPAERAQRQIGEVANATLGVGYSSRLNQEIRIKRGLSYGAGSATVSHPVGGMFRASVQTKNASAAEVLALARGEILRLGDALVPADELASRQAVLVGNFADKLETTSGLSSLVINQQAQGQPLAELGDKVQAIRAVTPEQVRDYARATWKPARLIGVVAGDMKATGDAFKGLEGRVVRMSLDDLDLGEPKPGKATKAP